MRGSSGLIHLWRSASGRDRRRHPGRTPAWAAGAGLSGSAGRFHDTGLWGTRSAHRSSGRDKEMAFILWLIAVVLVIGGIVTLVRGQILFGILLIVVGLLVGPGGVSIFT